MLGRVRLPALMAMVAASAFGQDLARIPAVASAPAAPAWPRLLGVLAPYSADQVIEQVRILPDGKRAPGQTLTSRVYRDSKGRQRTEPSAPSSAPITIMDPVAEVFYSLDATHKVARRRIVHHARPPLRAPERPSRSAPSEGTIENLGEKTIEGVPVRGTRRTVTHPAGGNRQPIPVVFESWASRELHIVVFYEIDNPVTGTRTQKLIHIARAEPDPKLFRPPADYTIVDDVPALLGAHAVPVSASLAAKPPASEPAMAPEPVTRPEPAPAPSAPAPIEETLDEASFADAAPPEDMPSETDSPADRYVGVNAVYVGASAANPAVPPSAPKAVAAHPKQPVPKIPPVPKEPKTPAPEKPAQ